MLWEKYTVLWECSRWDKCWSKNSLTRYCLIDIFPNCSGMSPYPPTLWFTSLESLLNWNISRGIEKFRMESWIRLLVSSLALFYFFFFSWSFCCCCCCCCCCCSPLLLINILITDFLVKQFQYCHFGKPRESLNSWVQWYLWHNGG